MSSYKYGNGMISPENIGQGYASGRATPAMNMGQGYASRRATPENAGMSYMTPQIAQPVFLMTGGRFGTPASGGMTGSRFAESLADPTPSRMFPRDVRLDEGYGGIDGGDPFVMNNGKDRKLSAVAPNFQPAPGTIFSTKSMADPGMVRGFGVLPQLEEQSPPDLTSTGSSHGSESTLSAEFSTDGVMTRVLKLSAVYSEVDAGQVGEILLKQQDGGFRLRGARQKIRVGDAMLLRFNDIRDAEATYNLLKAERQDWHIEFVEPGTISKVRGDGQLISKHEGQIYLIATLTNPGTFNRTKMETMLRQMIATHGDLYAFQKQLGTEYGIIKMVAEFCDHEAAKYTVSRLNGAIKKGMKLEVGLITPDIPATQNMEPYTTPVHPMGLNEVSGAMARIGITGPQYSQQSSGYGVLSPTNRTYINTVAPVSGPQYHVLNNPYGGAGSYYPANPLGYYTPAPAWMPQYNQLNPAFGTAYQQRGLNPVNVRALQWTYPGPYNAFSTPVGPGRGYVGYHPSMTPLGAPRRRQQRTSHAEGNPAHNIVNLENIRRGQDVRTTIMLRNIPNKIDQVMLKTIVDESSFGKYDFMYLRIDFANNCNVGYAFINFEDPYSIIDFVNARAGNRWNKFNSDKVAEVSYATIQGKDCLVQKFRNSSVMLEHPGFRPKIFYTTGHALVGQEEPFAEPDNPSKMRRSVENAEHVGLFAPRAGQHYRDEQRRRKSQYDRGTRLAEMEEKEYELEAGAEQYYAQANAEEYSHTGYPQAEYSRAGYPMTYDN